MSKTRQDEKSKNDLDLLLRVGSDKKSRVNNITDLLLRIRQELLLRVRQYKISRVYNDADLLLRIRRDEKRTEKNDADMLIKVR